MDLRIVNARGDIFPLINNEFFHLVNIDGQTRANSDISAVAIPGNDGDIVNNVQAQPRTIIIDLRVRSTVNVEDAKRAVLKVIKLKQTISLIHTQNNRTTALSGVVEAIEMPRWTKGVVMQITLHCAQPFWEDVDYILQRIDETKSLHYFTDDPRDMLYFPEEGIPLDEYDFSRTREFYNNGDVSVGMDIEILAYKIVTNPIIYDIDGNFFGVGYGTGIKKGHNVSGRYHQDNNSQRTQNGHSQWNKYSWKGKAEKHLASVASRR